MINDNSIVGLVTDLKMLPGNHVWSTELPAETTENNFNLKLNAFTKTALILQFPSTVNAIDILEMIAW